MLQFTFKFTGKFTCIFTFTFTTKLLIILNTFYATKLKFGMIFTQTKTLDFMVVASGRGQGSECITDHIEHMQNGNRIISLVPLLALESYKSGIMITDLLKQSNTLQTHYSNV